MPFVVDKVSYDSFYFNMLLGLPKVLNKMKGIKSTWIMRYPPLSYSQIDNWERSQGVILPNDLRQFYASSDGLLYSWNFEVEHENLETEEKEENNVEMDIIEGGIDINPLRHVVRLYGYETFNYPGVNMEGDRYIIKLAPESKLFELTSLEGFGRVVLIYLKPQFVPTIWLQISNVNFYFLADDVTSYMRMAIAHLGIPNWQFIYTPDGAPQWTENMFNLLAPHLLPLNKKIESMRRKQQQKYENPPSNKIRKNKLDPVVFTIKPKPELPSLLPKVQSVIMKLAAPKKKKLERPKSRTATKYQRRPFPLRRK